MISTDAEKQLTKSTSFYDKNTQKIGIEGNYLHIGQAIYEKPRANILNSKTLQDLSLSSKIRNKIMIPTFATFIQHIY